MFKFNVLFLGDLLIIMAQIIVATQMVVEEKFVMKYNVPALQGVGWEGKHVNLLLYKFSFIYSLQKKSIDIFF